ncbi:Histidine kinase [Chishuiella changwenlii]|uniref:Histidine kinase n=1 Tax=Chishuiella changwenlii TaxID=1434701 RepID=A0A1M6Y3P1_9FLAO|nr:histidine kinase [Chishuiella changwenlii]GGE93665.1 hypothetical protein GCM10010984_09140 [Chishuiella changwenlii]SHL12689.1 Histidine kinase [Chishuiella changwenlii]
MFKQRKYKIRNQKIISATKKRFVLWFIAFITYSVFAYLIDPFNPDLYDFHQKTIGDLLIDFFYGLVFSAIIVEVSIFIDNMLIKYLPWKNWNTKRLIIQCIFQILGSILFVISSLAFFDYIFGWLQNLSYKEEYTIIAQSLASNIIVSLLISTFNTVDYLVYNWKKTELLVSQHKLKVSEHKQAATEAELQAIKLQIDPHFIFNSLSVLSELILKDQKLGYEYSESFAKVYRYLLVNSKKDAVTLEEELKFLDSYIYLISKRFEDGVDFKIDIASNYKKFSLPPLALQFLVENALKHNQTSKKNPLIIKIYTENDNYLIVENNLIPLVNKKELSGFGLKNLMKRFEFFGDKKVIILNDQKDYIAKIPLHEN